MRNEVRKGYNGWNNYETWVANLWLDESYHAVCELVDQCIRESDDRDDAVRMCREAIKELMESDIPDLGSSFAADMLSAAMHEVDWHEIAEHRIEDSWTDDLASVDDE